jgi:hypothetical protein
MGCKPYTPILVTRERDEMVYRCPLTGWRYGVTRWASGWDAWEGTDEYQTSDLTMRAIRTALMAMRDE